MALNKSALEAGINAAFAIGNGGGSSADVAAAIAAAIDDFVKSAEVTTESDTSDPYMAPGGGGPITEGAGTGTLS